jgi:hypothetical protein
MGGCARRATVPGTPAAALSATHGDADVSTDAPQIAVARGPALAADDPGYLELAPPDEAVLRRREQDIDADRLPEFAREKVL